MRIRTKYQNKENIYEIYFCYMPYYGGEKYGNYDDMAADGDIPNIETEGGYLVAYLYSFYFGTTSLLTMRKLREKPARSMVREFIKSVRDEYEESRIKE